MLFACFVRLRRTLQCRSCKLRAERPGRSARSLQLLHSGEPHSGEQSEILAYGI